MSLVGEVAGDMSVLPGITCWLYEGTVTRALGESRTGLSMVTVTRTAPIQPGDMVMLYDDAAFTYSALQGLPIVKKVDGSGNFYVGEVLSQPDRAPNIPADDTPVTIIANQIAQGLLRKATVEFNGLLKTKLAEASAGSGEVITVGGEATIEYDVSDGKYKYVASDGVGVVPFHHVAESTTAKVLLGIGMTKIKVVA